MRIVNIPARCPDALPTLDHVRLTLVRTRRGEGAGSRRRAFLIVSQVATALRNHLDFGTVRWGPANAMNNSGTVTRGGGSGATLEAFPRPARIYRDWHISRCRRACVSRK